MRVLFGIAVVLVGSVVVSAQQVVTPESKVGVYMSAADVNAAVAWYTEHLGFTVLNNVAPAFADVKRGSLRLLHRIAASGGANLFQRLRCACTLVLARCLSHLSLHG